MTEEEIYERLNEVFRDVFDDDTIEVDDLTTARHRRLGQLRAYQSNCCS